MSEPLISKLIDSSRKVKGARKIKNSESLVRSSESDAVINTNDVEYNTYIKQKQMRDAMINRIVQHDQELSLILKELKEIHKVVKKIESQLGK